MSTAVTCSFVGLFVGCDLKNKKKSIQADTIKIGVQSDLLSFDPFSFQAMGEGNITELLYDRLIIFDKNKIKSDFDVDLSFKKNALLIKRLDPKIRKKIKDVFVKSRSSVLWKDLFKPFEFKKSESSPNAYQITYSGDSNFISNLKSLAPLLVVDGGPQGAYKIDSIQKGSRLVLVKNPEWRGSTARMERMVLVKTKSIADGLKQVSQKELDVFVPFEPTQKGNLEPYKDIRVQKSKNKNQHLRLFLKHNANSPLRKVFCSNRAEVLKVLEKDWVLSARSCNGRFDTVEPKNINVIMTSKFADQVLDLLEQIYKKKTGKTLAYDRLDNLETAKRLNAGDFDHYLSIDVESSDLPVLFDSFHSKGRYNSLNIKDALLDLHLEKASKASTLVVFNQTEVLARARLKVVLPYVFEYSRPHTDFIVHKKTSLKILKSSKTLMKFQK